MKGEVLGTALISPWRRSSQACWDKLVSHCLFPPALMLAGLQADLQTRIQLSAPNPEHVNMVLYMQQADPGPHHPAASAPLCPEPRTLSLAQHTSQDTTDATSTHSHRKPGRGSGTSYCHTGASEELCQQKQARCEGRKCSHALTLLLGSDCSSFAFTDAPQELCSAWEQHSCIQGTAIEQLEQPLQHSCSCLAIH